MLLDRTHSRWAVLSGLTLTLGAVAWIACSSATPNGNSGGSVSGLLFGILGTTMMFFAGLLGARRPLRHRRIGSASFWLKGHLWLGTLCIPFILFHASFAWGGPLEQILWICLFFVAASGFFGLTVQQFLPRLLSKNVPLESFEPQSPWLCDRMTLASDIRIAAACEQSFPEISEHLLPTARQLVKGFDEISAGKESRGEKNARKLLLMQKLAPGDQRDFFWAMAKVAKSDLKALTFEGDFAELLAKTYRNLRELRPASNTPTPAQTAPAAQTTPLKHADPQPIAAAHSRTTSPPKEHPQSTQTSPIELMKQKAAQKAAEAAATNAAAAPVESPAPAPETTAATATPPKLSPLELMKQKAAQKAAATAAAVPAESPAPTPETPAAAAIPPKLSPLELMKQKAAQKAADAAAAASSTTAAPAESLAPATETTAAAATPPKLSPLELMKQKAAQKAADAAAAASSTTAAPAESPVPATETPAAAAIPPKLSPLELMKQKAAPTPAATAPKPAVASDLPGPAAKPPLTPAKASPPGSGSPPVTPASTIVSAAPSPEDRQILWKFYTQQVRPFLSNSRSSAAVKNSPLADDLDASRRFREIQATLPIAHHELLQELQSCCNTRRQIEQQRTILRWMHWWLALHIPVSLLLIVFTVAHIVMALRVVPFRF